jgi:hypothetical protein
MRLNWMAKQLKLGAVGSWANLLRLWEKNNNMWLCGTDPFPGNLNPAVGPDDDGDDLPAPFWRDGATLVF